MKGALDIKKLLAGGGYFEIYTQQFTIKRQSTQRGKGDF
jgi:hypothetical protein